MISPTRHITKVCVQNVAGLIVPAFASPSPLWLPSCPFTGSVGKLFLPLLSIKRAALSIGA
jgi:hypothetical protein